MPTKVYIPSLSYTEIRKQNIQNILYIHRACNPPQLRHRQPQFLRRSASTLTSTGNDRSFVCDDRVGSLTVRGCACGGNGDPRTHIFCESFDEGVDTVVCLAADVVGFGIHSSEKCVGIVSVKVWG